MAYKRVHRWLVNLFTPYTEFYPMDFYPVFIQFQLLDWIRRTMPWLNSRQTDNSLAGCQKKLEDYRTYR